jgi:5-formyltetrahydrofolate cyclo-ligase
MHEIDPALGMPVDRQQARDVDRWRRVQRERLIAARLALSAEERTEHAQRIARDLDGIVTPTPSTIVSVYWPFRGEPDLRCQRRSDLASAGRSNIASVLNA